MPQAKTEFLPSTLLLLSLAHLVTDLSQGALPALLPELQKAYNLTYAQIGFMVLMQNMASSVIQPIFGYLSDRIALPWLIPAGVIISGLGMASLVFADSYFSLLATVTIGGLGVAAFHPQGSKAAHLTSAKDSKGHSMGIFSVGGNLGFALGAMFITFLLHLSGGLTNIIWFALPALILAPILWSQLRRIVPSVPAVSRRATVEALQTHRPIPWSLLTVLLTYIFIRSSIHTGLSTYIPLYYVNYLSGSAFYASNLLSVFFLSGVVGTYAGGRLSDKWGRKTIIMASMAATLPLVAILPYTSGIATVILVGLIGFVMVSSFSTTIVLAQEAMPSHIGMAGGLTIGFSIGLGGVGATVLGNVADVFGIPAVFTLLACLPLAGLVCTFFLPGSVGRSTEPKIIEASKGI
jgi:FSR family fosmidomycin resistance protein-like MFS transporter